MSKYNYYKKMKMIRSFENMVLDLFSQNEISGTTHTCIGQEAIAVAAMENIMSDDIVFSNHRCHGHYIAYGGPIDALLAEIMSREGGLCGGRGGSQHLHYKNFFSNGIQGGIVPNATGMAWANKLQGKNGIGLVFLGDGTLGQGVVYETMNMANLYHVPILYVIENNQYAMTTKVSDGVSGSIMKRAEAFGIHTCYTNSVDIEELVYEFQNVKEYVRNNQKPACIVVDTYRLGAHSKGEDTRDKAEIEKYWEKDPLKILKEQLDAEKIKEIDDEIQGLLDEMVKDVKQRKFTTLEIENLESENILSESGFINEKKQKCLEQINLALGECLDENEKLMLLGEDICDEYGGAFKVTKGLSSRFNGRVINTPISEAGFTGMAVGLAMNGMIPIVEMMFGDFITLTFDQILNHATKYQWLYGEKIKVPMILRAPMGGGRGYGPTHSQSLEKYFLGMPGLEIVALSPVHNNYELYKYMIKNVNKPVIVIENKTMYGELLLCMDNNRVGKFMVKTLLNDKYPTIYLSFDINSRPDVTVFVYGMMLKEVMKAAVEVLVEEEIQVDIAVLSQIYPLPQNDLEEIMNQTGKIITVEEGTLDAGWGSELIAQVVTKYTDVKCARVAYDNSPIANGKHLEESQAVNGSKIIEAIRGIYYEN